MVNNYANPREYIYLLAQVVFKPNTKIMNSTEFTWTYSTHPVYPPEKSTSDIRVNNTIQELFKIEKNKLEDNTTYWFRAAGNVTYQIYYTV